MTLRIFSSLQPGALLICSAVLAFIAQPARTQTWNVDDLNQDQDVSAPRKKGLAIQSISTSGSYYSHALPADFLYLTQNNVSYGSDITTTSSVALGYWLPGRLSDLAIVYTPTYTSSARYSEWNRLNHYFTLRSRAGKPVKRIGRWSFDLKGHGEIDNFENFLFAPQTLSQVASTPSSFDDLTGAVSHSPTNNDQLSSLLSAPGGVESPARLLFYGDRVLNVAGNLNASYAYSPRLSISFSTGGSHLQPLPSNIDVPGASVISTQLRTTSFGGNTAITYSLSPKTSIGWGVDVRRNISQLSDAYLEWSTVSFSHVFSPHWYLEARAGGGSIQPIHNTAPLPIGMQFVAGAVAGYRLHTHTFLVSVDRTLSDEYAFGAGSSINVSAAWNWRRRGSHWLLNGAILHQNLNNQQVHDFSSWMIQAGVRREITRQLSASVQYSHAAYSGFYTNQLFDVGIDGARVSLLWTPSPLPPGRRH
ncbi:MAG: hypothetical protein JO022_13665 [Acidobacteriaceae bacterium]|nr:hypothetical protein [Acidobacteriaceae bacterium]